MSGAGSGGGGAIPWAIMVELRSDAADPAAASAEARARLAAAGLTDATIHAVWQVYDHVGPYPEEERNFDAEGRPLGRARE